MEPDGLAALRLAELRPRRGQQERVGHRIRVGRPIRAGLRRPPDQLEPRGDVAPLVGAAHLQLAAEGPVEMLEVGRLDEHVAEFGERQAGLEPHLDRVLGEHVRDREVLAHVTQEVEQADRLQPLRVVVHDRAARPTEVEEPLQLRSDRGHVRLDLLARLQVALGGASRRVADHARPATDEGDRASAAELEPDEPEDRHQVADVQPRS